MQFCVRNHMHVPLLMYTCILTNTNRFLKA